MYHCTLIILTVYVHSPGHSEINRGLKEDACKPGLCYIDDAKVEGFSEMT
jgi:hypothetical protein